jgi:DNA-binding transcriptional MerR regulator
MDKSPEAFRTISEVAEALETPAHVLRFWESRFPQIRPVKRAGGRRYYRPADVALLTGIKRLLHDEGMTIRGVQKILREQGIRHVAGLSDEPSPEEAALDEAMIARFDADADLAPEEVADETAAALAAALDPDPMPEPVPDPVPEPEAVAAADDGAAATPAGSAMDWLAALPEDTAAMATDDAPPLPFDAPPPPDPPARPALSVSSVTGGQVLSAQSSEDRPDDATATLAARLRALPLGSLAARQDQMATLAARVRTLRARLSGQMPTR